MNPTAYPESTDPTASLNAFPEAFADYRTSYLRALEHVARTHGGDELAEAVLHLVPEDTIFSPAPLLYLNDRCQGAAREVMPEMVAEQQASIAAKHNKPRHRFRSASTHALGSAAIGLLTVSASLHRPYFQWHR